MGLARQLRRPVVWLPISVGLLVFLAWRSRIWEAGDRLTIEEPMALVAAVAISGVVPVLWALRSADLLGAADRPVGVGPLIPMTVFANTINNLTPGSAGEIVRVWLLRAHHGVDYATGTAVVAIERLGAFGYLAGSALIVWLGYVRAWSPVVVLLLVAALVALPGIVYGLGLRPSAIVAAVPLGRIVGPGRWTRATGWLRRVDTTVAGLITHPLRLALFALLTFSLLACYTTQLVLVGRALGEDMAPLPAWGALGLAMTAGVLSMLPFGLGTTDLVLIALLGVAGVDPVTATAMTFGYRLVSSLPLGLAGVVSYAWLSARLPAGGARGAMAAVGAALEDGDRAASRGDGAGAEPGEPGGPTGDTNGPERA